ncbi:MAG: hypothetical protein Q9202_003806 [Teloschistes flavicans]
MSFFSHVRVPSLSSVYFRDDRVPDVGADYSRLSALKRYQWSRQEKEVLYLMSDFDNSSIQLWATFRAYFAEKYSKGPKPRKLAWEAMRNYLAHKARHSKQSTHSFALRRAKARISSVAVSIGIQLHTKAQTGPLSKSRLQKQKKVPSPDRSDTSPSENDWSSDGSNYSEGVTDQSPAILVPPELHSTPSASRVFPLGGLLTPPSTDRKKHRIWGTQGGGTDKGVPQLAFRAFNNGSQGLNGIDGFVAGSFVGQATIPALPTDAQYLLELERHLAREHSGHTPFISVCENLMRVIHHAVRRDQKIAKSPGSEWKLAVINLSKVPGLVRAVWHLDAGEHSRKAFGEWVVNPALVWGAVPSSNVLAIVSMDELLGCMKQTLSPFYIHTIQRARYTGQARKAIVASIKRDLNYNDGISVGLVVQFLGIPNRHLKYTTHMILNDWRHPERLHRAWERNLDFIRGLDMGYHLTCSDFEPIAIETERDERLSRCFGTSQIPSHENTRDTTVQHANQALPDSTEWLTDFLTELETVAEGL